MSIVDLRPKLTPANLCDYMGGIDMWIHDGEIDDIIAIKLTKRRRPGDDITFVYSGDPTLSDEIMKQKKKCMKEITGDALDVSTPDFTPMGHRYKDADHATVVVTGPTRGLLRKFYDEVKVPLVVYLYSGECNIKTSIDDLDGLVKENVAFVVDTSRARVFGFDGDIAKSTNLAAMYDRQVWETFMPRRIGDAVMCLQVTMNRSLVEPVRLFKKKEVDGERVFAVPMFDRLQEMYKSDFYGNYLPFLQSSELLMGHVKDKKKDIVRCLEREGPTCDALVASMPLMNPTFRYGSWGVYGKYTDVKEGPDTGAVWSAGNAEEAAAILKSEVSACLGM